jgi:hypothetical protein
VKRTYSKLAAQPECSKHRPKTATVAMSTADRVRASLLMAPPPRG